MSRRGRRLLTSSLSAELPRRRSYRTVADRLAPEPESAAAIGLMLQSTDSVVRVRGVNQAAGRIVSLVGLTEEGLCGLRMALRVARGDPSPEVRAAAQSVHPETSPKVLEARAETDLRILEVVQAASAPEAVASFDKLVEHLVTVDRWSCIPMAPRRILCEWLGVTEEGGLWNHLVQRPTIARGLTDLALRYRTCTHMEDIGHLRRQCKRRDDAWVHRLQGDLDVFENTAQTIGEIVRLVDQSDRVSDGLDQLLSVAKEQFPLQVGAAAQGTRLEALLNS